MIVWPNVEFKPRLFLQQGTTTGLSLQQGTTTGLSLLQGPVVYTFLQCCGSGMIYSRSGLNYKFSEFRIRIRIWTRILLVPVIKHIWNLFLKNPPCKFNQEKNIPVPIVGITNYLPFSISQYSPTPSPEFTSVK